MPRESINIYIEPQSCCLATMNVCGFQLYFLTKQWEGENVGEIDTRSPWLKMRYINTLVFIPHLYRGRCRAGGGVWVLCKCERDGGSGRGGTVRVSGVEYMSSLLKRLNTKQPPQSHRHALVKHRTRGVCFNLADHESSMPPGSPRNTSPPPPLSSLCVSPTLFLFSHDRRVLDRPRP